MQFAFALKFGNVREAVCQDPKITGVYNDKIPAYIKANLEYRLERYCQMNKGVPANLAANVLTKLNFGKVRPQAHTLVFQGCRVFNFFKLCFRSFKYLTLASHL